MSQERSIVFFDIDGTIFEMGKGTPESTRTALGLLKEKGHIPVVCSGRPKATLFPEVLDLGFSGIIGGAGAYVEFQGEVLRSVFLEQPLQGETVRKLERRDCCVVLEGPDYISYRGKGEAKKYFRGLDRLHREYPDRVKEMEEDSDRASKMTIFFYEEERFPFLDQELSLGKHFSLARYEREAFVEMMPKGINKADGIRVLLEHLGLPVSRTYAFGDGPNDLEMLQYVQYGTAMGNAEENVRKAAGYQTEGIWEDGVYRALKRYGLI